MRPKLRLTCPIRRRTNVRCLVGATLLLAVHTASCTSPPPQAARPTEPARPAEDFAVRLDYKGCNYEYLDTFNGTFGGTMTVPFILSAEERDTLFAAVMAADFFERPADLGTGKDPSNNFKLEVRNAGRRHTVKWTAESKWGQSEDALPLWHLQASIFKVLENHFGPDRGGGCNSGK